MRGSLIVAIVAEAFWSVSASAQTTQDTFQQLSEAGRLETGDSYVVKRRDGTRVTGQLQGLSAGSLRMCVPGDLLELAEADVERIERRDRADDGFWLGVLAGAGATAAIVAARCDHSECGFYVSVGYGGPLLVGGGIAGYIVDRAMRRVVFDRTTMRAARISVNPSASRRHRAVALSVAW